MPEKKRLNDVQLLAALKEGDKDAIVQLYKDNFQAVKSHIMRNGGNTDDVEDVLQDACIAVWEKARDNSLELKARLSTFVFAISKNLWLKKLRKLGRQSNMDDSFSENLSVPEETFSSENRHIIIKMMDKLGTNCKEILLMFYFEGYDMLNIAQKLNYNNADTAKAKKHQCFRHLQDLIKNRYDLKDFTG